MNTDQMMIALKGLTFRACLLDGYGTSSIPETMHTAAIPVISLFLRGYPNPISLAYEDEEQRDADLALLNELRLSGL